MSDTYLHKRIGGRAGKMKLAHHYIWEQRVGTIPTGFQIHHVDHNKKNNDIENLKLVSTSEHQRIHSKYYVLLNGEWVRFCKYCKVIGNPQKSTICDPCRARMARIERRSNGIK